MKLFIYDFETTGLDAKVSAPHQLSGMISVDGKIMETFNFHIKPFEGALIDGQALAIAGVTEEQINSYEEGSEVYKKLCNILIKYVSPYEKDITKKFVTVGYNNHHFDDDFLYNFFQRYSDISPDETKFNKGFYKGNLFNKYVSLDMYQASLLILGPMGYNLPDYKLGTIAIFLDCLPKDTDENFHDASFDILTTLNLFKFFYKEGYIKLFKKE